VNSIAIALTGFDVRQVNMPGKGVDFFHSHPALLTFVVEKAQVDCLGDLREQREVGARPVVHRS
jgi:hypothetical protein